MLLIIQSRDHICLQDHFSVFIDPQMLFREIYLHITAAETMVVIWGCSFRSAVERLPLDLFILVQFFPQLLLFLCLVYSVAVVALSGHRDLVPIMCGKGMLFIDRVHLVGKFLYIVLDALIPDVVISVIITFVVHFQPVFEDRSVQYLRAAARQLINNSASGQFVELLCLFIEALIIFSDLRTAVDPFRVFKIDRCDLPVHCGKHRVPHKLRIKSCAFHLRSDCKSAVHIVKTGVLRRDHGIHVHLRHRVKHFQEFLFGILLLFADLMGIASYEPLSPQIRILLREDRVQTSVGDIMVVYIFSRNRKLFSIPERHFQVILPQYLFHFGDRAAVGFYAVDHSSRDKGIPVVQRLIDIKASGQHCRR